MSNEVLVVSLRSSGEFTASQEAAVLKLAKKNNRRNTLGTDKGVVFVFENEVDAATFQRDVARCTEAQAMTEQL